MDETIAHERLELPGAQGLHLAADRWTPRDVPEPPLALLLHGGGQTRHSWKSATVALAEAGLDVVALDLRGHGDSDRSPDRRYSLLDHRDDVLAALAVLPGPVTLVGASLGGLTSLLVTQAAPERVRALVVVDIVVRPEPDGVERVLGFMNSAPDGFADLDEAADAIAGYLPHRPRRRNPEGLRKNLRQGADGRWRWHWDPHMFSAETRATRENLQPLVEEAAASVTVPTLLLHGQRSDVVGEEGVADLRRRIPHLEVVPLASAAHTAAADDNDAFSSAVVEFCTRASARA